MRLFHVSEEPDIREFLPRLPKRADLDPGTGLVWAMEEFYLPNFLTPRDCPRVAYHVGERTTEADRRAFFSSDTMRYAVVIENKWVPAMLSAVLYLYEFDPDDFVLQDAAAGYYVSKNRQTPIAKYQVKDLFGQLAARNVEIRIVDHLWDIADRVKGSTLDWSLCRMAFAQPRP